MHHRRSGVATFNLVLKRSSAESLPLLSIQISSLPRRTQHIYCSIMNLQTAKSTVGIVAIVGMYQFLHVKDPSFPSLFTLIAYVVNCITMVVVIAGGYYGIHQYLGLLKYAITEDLLGMGTSSPDKLKKVHLKAASKHTEQDSDPEDPENYNNIG